MKTTKTAFLKATEIEEQGVYGFQTDEQLPGWVNAKLLYQLWRLLWKRGYYHTSGMYITYDGAPYVIMHGKHDALHIWTNAKGNLATITLKNGMKVSFPERDCTMGKEKLIQFIGNELVKDFLQSDLTI